MPRKKFMLQQLIDEQAEELREDEKLSMVEDLADEEDEELEGEDDD